MSRVVLFGGRLGCACFVLQFHALSCANFRRSSHRYQNKKTSHVCDQFTVAGSVFGLCLNLLVRNTMLIVTNRFLK